MINYHCAKIGAMIVLSAVLVLSCGQTHRRGQSLYSYCPEVPVKCFALSPKSDRLELGCKKLKYMCVNTYRVAYLLHYIIILQNQIYR